MFAANQMIGLKNIVRISINSRELSSARRHQRRLRWRHFGREGSRNSDSVKAGRADQDARSNANLRPCDCVTSIVMRPASPLILFIGLVGNY